MLNQESIMQALRGVKYPGYSRDVVSFGLVKQVAVNEGAISIQFELTSHNAEAAAQIKKECDQVLRALDGVKLVHIEVKMPPAAQNGAAPATAGPNPWSNQNRVPGLARIVAVASGKGGVGKSTCSVNLACALKQLGARVGLLDCDIYGPSIPLMMGIKQRPTISASEKMIPPSNHGVKLMSMGFLVDGDQPVIWRGPMIMKTSSSSSTPWNGASSIISSSTSRPAPATHISTFARPSRSTAASSSPPRRRPRWESSERGSPCSRKSMSRSSASWRI